VRERSVSISPRCSASSARTRSIGLAGGINPYVYAENDPVSLRDPSGLCPEPGYRCYTGYAPVRVRSHRYHAGRTGWGMEHGASAYEAALAEWETEQFLAFWHYEWEQTQQALGAAREWVSDNQQCLAASGGAALSSTLSIRRRRRERPSGAPG
jgi:hypothetical protein